MLVLFIQKPQNPKDLMYILVQNAHIREAGTIKTTALLCCFHLIKSLTQQECHNDYLLGGYAVPEITKINGINVIVRAYFATDIMII